MAGIGMLATYMIVNFERRESIEKETDHLITDACYRRTDNRPLDLPAKRKFIIAGRDTWQAVTRYNEVYTALQEQGDTADPRELQELFERK